MFKANPKDPSMKIVVISTAVQLAWLDLVVGWGRSRGDGGEGREEPQGRIGRTGKSSCLAALRGVRDSLQKDGSAKKRHRCCSGRVADRLIRYLIEDKADLPDVVP
jgi:hypothetical protein